MSKKLQLTIDFLLNKSDNYFCLKWNSRDGPDEFPYFSGERLEKSNFSFGFLNKLTHIPIILSGQIKSRKDKLLVELPMPNEIPTYSNIHLLKSHLQKAIRLQNTSLAISTARHLLDINPIQFLRRLAIIFVEDVMITQHYSTLIWLMIGLGSNKIELQLHHIEWLLGLVYIACKCPFKEVYKCDMELSDEKLAKIILEKLDKLDKYQSCVIQAMLMRSAFGGMPGDTRMLLNAAYIWCERFISEDKRWEKYYYGKLRTISGSVLPLGKGDWILSAVDYHSFPKLLEWLGGEIELDELYMRELIWNFSSKINNRKYYGGELEEKSQGLDDWNKIRKQFYSIGRYVIKNYS